jgi:hypothetical protein
MVRPHLDPDRIRRLGDRFDHDWLLDRPPRLAGALRAQRLAVAAAPQQAGVAGAEILSGREAADDDRPAPAKAREVPQAETPPAETQAEATAETPPADSAPDLGAEIAAAVRALGGQTKAAAVLKPIASSFGVGKLSEIPQNRINEAITAIRAAVEGAKS